MSMVCFSLVLPPSGHFNQLMQICVIIIIIIIIIINADFTTCQSSSPFSFVILSISQH